MSVKMLPVAAVEARVPVAVEGLVPVAAMEVLMPVAAVEGFVAVTVGEATVETASVEMTAMSAPVAAAASPGGIRDIRGGEGQQDGGGDRKDLSVHGSTPLEPRLRREADGLVPIERGLDHHP